ncbi:flagellar biosynthesis protein FlhB [Eubacterium multiforme]|uniref:Flagellar biosynthetic protein FlhB n=1 Tax=Eubacterium multiforme TaxID=83339 RepID=A0ABT9UUB0_9FIRM|nr:flagellar biosynthesis protein FlhB [Eubacterium multiforme]MDQ0149917.1 flagellar biosynthetic protein FliR/FlhB [Eubacterium multiforme]
MNNISEKTEKATPKKKKDERKKGNVAKSKEAINALTLIGSVMSIFYMSNFAIGELKTLIASFLRLDFNTDFNKEIVKTLLNNGIVIFLKIFLPIGLIILCIGVIGNVMQTGLLFTKESIKPKFSKINPINGFKNMFSQRAFVSLLKNTLLLIILSYIGYSFVKNNYGEILRTGDIYFPNLIYVIFLIVKKLFYIAILIAVVIGILDFAYQFYSHNKKMKMSKQEIKDEFKQAEGDPQVKGQIKQKQREMANARMIQSTKDATVVVTNPTHLSIALRYDREIDSAPVVLAKGADVLAMNIRKIAKENDIPIIENKPFARFIYKEVEVNEEVPEEMYSAVAEVLVAVYKIKNRYKKNR